MSYQQATGPIDISHSPKASENRLTEINATHRPKRPTPAPWLRDYRLQYQVC